MMLLVITASGAAAVTKLAGADVGGLDPTFDLSPGADPRRGAALRGRWGRQPSTVM
jgi:hypothetical protein